ncbi:MAG: adenylate kinase, partial [Bacteroidota bacterium]
MLYLIGGASRTGKTLMAKQLSSQMGIPYLSLDWIMMGFTNGIPEYGVHDKLFPDDIAKRLWPFYKAMFESMIAVDTTCIIEGEALLPGLLTQFVQEYPKELKVCFMGYVNVDLVKKVE